MGTDIKPCSSGGPVAGGAWVGDLIFLSLLLCARLIELSYSRSGSFGHGAARVSAPLVSCNRRHVLFHTCVNAMCARLFELSYSRSSSFGHGAARVSAPLVSCSSRHIFLYMYVNSIVRKLLRS